MFTLLTLHTLGLISILNLVENIIVYLALKLKVIGYTERLGNKTDRCKFDTSKANTVDGRNTMIPHFLAKNNQRFYRTLQQ